MHFNKRMADKKVRGRKFRSPKLTRIEKLTKGLLAERDVNTIFTVKEVKGKGRGVFLRAQLLRKDSFVLEYEGDIISEAEAQQRERIYAHNNEGCFIMSFTFKGAKLAIDATRRFDSIARLLNHSREPNIRFHPPILIDLNSGLPRIASYALRDIFKGEEIVIDYGVRDGHISWLRNREIGFTTDVDSDSSDDNDRTSSKNSHAELSQMSLKVSSERPMCPDYDASCSLSSDITSAEGFTLARLDTHISELKRSRKDMSSMAFNGDWGVRFTSLIPQGHSKNYFAGLESIGLPQKIMKFIEDTSGSRKQKSDSESIVCLSTSSSGSSKRSRATSASRRKNVSSPPSSEILDRASSTELPSNEAPDSIHKVLEWQKHSSLDNPIGIKIVGVQSLSDPPYVEDSTDCDHSTFYRQHNNLAFQAQEISASSQPRHASESSINLHRINQNDQLCGASSSFLLPLSPTSKNAEELVVSLDTSESDDESDSSILSYFSLTMITAPRPRSEPETVVKGKTSIEQSDVCVVSDDECMPETAVLSKQQESVGRIDVMKAASCNEDESSSECEIILTEIPNSSHESGQLARNLPAQRTNGFSSPSAQLQVTVIKPFVSPSTSQNSQQGAVTMTESEIEQLKIIFRRHIVSSKVSQDEVQQAIYSNWDIFSVLIQRGVSLKQIRSTFSSFFKPQR